MKSRVRLKPIALPSEHGSWGFLLEPLLLGLALAPTLAGFSLALAVAAAFLVRNPLRVFLRARGGGSPRFAVARRVALFYGIVAVLGVVAGAAVAGVAPLWPLAAVSPLAVVFVHFDARNRGRSMTAELLAPAGLAAATPAIVLAAGWPTAAAVTAWVVVVIKALPTVIYIRARLRLEDGVRVTVWPSATAHLLAVAVAVGLWWWGAVPLSVAGALAVLAARGIIGLTPVRWGRTPKQIGVLEFVFSGIYVVAVAAGYHAMA
jgi:hypothetical protein